MAQHISIITIQPQAEGTGNQSQAQGTGNQSQAQGTGKQSQADALKASEVKVLGQERLRIKSPTTLASILSTKVSVTNAALLGRGLKLPALDPTAG